MRFQPAPAVQLWTHECRPLAAAENLGAILADPRKVKQIVYNLLANAVKFIPEGGHMTLRAGRVSRTHLVRLSGSRPGRALPLAHSAFAEFVEFTVTGSGIGISPEHLDRLFTPFSQIDSSLARKFEGTGLGLTMVKLLAELHGGLSPLRAPPARAPASQFGCLSGQWRPPPPASDRAANGYTADMARIMGD